MQIWLQSTRSPHTNVHVCKNGGWEPLYVIQPWNWAQREWGNGSKITEEIVIVESGRSLFQRVVCVKLLPIWGMLITLMISATAARDTGIGSELRLWLLPGHYEVSSSEGPAMLDVSLPVVQACQDRKPMASSHISTPYILHSGRSRKSVCLITVDSKPQAKFFEEILPLYE